LTFQVAIRMAEYLAQSGAERKAAAKNRLNDKAL
jgi:hypothetical protein